MKTSYVFPYHFYIQRYTNIKLVLKLKFKEKRLDWFENSSNTLEDHYISTFHFMLNYYYFSNRKAELFFYYFSF